MDMLKSLLAIALLIFLTQCRTKPSDCPEFGYCSFKQDITKDSMEHIRNKIKAVPFNQFEPYIYHGSDSPAIPYRLLRPVNQEEGRKYPLVLVFHSSGTPIGTNNISQLAVPTLYWAQPDIRARYPAFVLAPQFPKRSSNYQLDSAYKVQGSVPDPSLDLVLQLLDSLKATLPIDGKRIYVLGFSMGGSTTINAIAKRPGLFAAGIELSGIPSFDHLETLEKTPLWLVHGNGDPENKFASDSLFYKLLVDKGDQQIRFWEVKKMGHQVYGGLLAGDAMPTWLFSKRRP